MSPLAHVNSRRDVRQRHVGGACATAVGKAKTRWDAQRDGNALIRWMKRTRISSGSGSIADGECQLKGLSDEERMMLRFRRMTKGLAKMKRDRFAALEAGPEPGTLLTLRKSLRGRGLTVNAEMDGELRVAG